MDKRYNTCSPVNPCDPSYCYRDNDVHLRHPERSDSFNAQRKHACYSQNSKGNGKTMKIAILGGTGSIGEGFALRWAGKHDILVCSREIDKAVNAAEEYTNILLYR